jgi:CO dehydrogenase/acetyl-CoA synthase gamma subunit (corrinoid Fe-S protein)
VDSVSDSYENVSRINSVEELEVFKRSHKLTLDIYKVTKEFPQTEKFGLVAQMRRTKVIICNLKADVEHISMMLNGLVRSLTDTKH